MRSVLVDFVGATTVLVVCNNLFSNLVMEACACVEHVSISMCIDMIDKSSAYEEI